MEAKNSSQAQPDDFTAIPPTPLTTWPEELPVWPPADAEIAMAVENSLRTGDWGRYESSARDELSRRLARQFACQHVRLCCSGTAAIELAIRAAGVKAADEVIVAAYDYPGIVRSIELLGATPVLVDVDSRSATLAPSHLDAAASDNVRAVIATHIFGRAANVELIRQACDDRGWILIEDVCQTPGMQINGRPAGSWGHIAALSFGGSKPLTAGNGGAVLTSDDRLATRLNPIVDRPSNAYPLSPLQAAILLPQLDRLSERVRQRNRTAHMLEQTIAARLPRWTPTRQLSDGAAASSDDPINTLDEINRTDHRSQAQAHAAVEPSFYKFAWTAPSPQERQRVLLLSEEFGLPLGPGFRDAARMSPRRCRKPVPLPQSQRFGETLFVLDHRALMLLPHRHDQLADTLVQIHDAAAE